jgi:hypothetical protein
MLTAALIRRDPEGPSGVGLMTTLEPAQHEILLKLLDEVQQGEQPSEGPYRPRKWWHRRARPSFGLEGEGVQACWAVVRALARPALSGNGLSVQQAERIAAAACAAQVDIGQTAAVEAVERALTSPARRWVVVRPWSGLDVRLGQGEITVGGCVIQHGIPPDLLAPLYADPWTSGPTIRVEAHAHDEEGAELIATQRFEEAIAVLHCADPTARLRYGTETILIGEHQVTGHYQMPGGEGLVVGLFDNAGELFVPPFRELSVAAATPSDSRSELQRRVVTASRWHSRAVASEWPTDALVAAMITVETLIGANDGRGKGQILGQRAAAFLGGLVDDHRAFRKWFQALYNRSRNPAMHAGLEPTDEIAVGKLVDMCGTLLEWSAFHLDERHSRAGACFDLDAMLACPEAPSGPRRRRSRPGQPAPVWP